MFAHCSLRVIAPEGYRGSVGGSADPFHRLVATSAGRLSDGTMAPPIVAGPRSGVAPLTFFQEMRWNRLRLDPFDQYFLDGYGQHLAGRIDVDALESTLEEIFARDLPLPRSAP